MKFEQLLQVYWSKGFLYGGKVKKFDTTLIDFFYDKSGLSTYAKKLLVKRFELNEYVFEKNKSLIEIELNFRKVINMYLSQIISINNSIFELIKFNIVRLYLIKTFRGRSQALGKPCRGQRTWSNSSNAYKCNRVLRLFINEVKRNNVIEKKVESLNLKIIKKKVRRQAPKIKMVKLKKKKNLWF